MACTFTGHDGHGFIHKEVLERMCTKEPFTQELNGAIRDEIAPIYQEL